MTNQNCRKFCHKCGNGISYDAFLLILVTHIIFSSLLAPTKRHKQKYSMTNSSIVTRNSSQKIIYVVVIAI